jgi:hypothetical protein
LKKTVKYCLGVPFAIGDAVLAILSSFRRKNLDHQPRAGHNIPEDFFGINVATCLDENCDAYVIARLRELNINNVRLAFSCDSPGGPPARLLDKLLAEKFIVTLVIKPVLANSRLLRADSRVQDQWRRLIRDLFDRYAGQVAVFEIGSTPNRRRWSGFRPQDYLVAWGIACEAAKDHDVCLAGPNVQDFEPFYNAALLWAMCRMGRVPEIHTNNLFVERVKEPEAYDHRVVGRWAANLLKLNLVKKARILECLGSKAGSSQTISTCSFWTTKRLLRWSPYPQEKKVDYLARYLVLAATSGALRRVYWGPLICNRDGLIDNAVVDYPDVDQSSLYLKVQGGIEDFNVTPAFHALGHVVRRLRGARCETAMSDVAGLSHFAFTGSDGGIFHVCWCRDGRVVRLKDLYGEEQLTGAIFSDPCGQNIESPVIVNERPLFIYFPGLTKNTMPEHGLDVSHTWDDGLIYLSQPGIQGIPWQNRAWRGAYTASDQRSALSLGNALQPENIVCLPELAVLRDRRNRLWNIAHPLDPRQQLTVKYNRPSSVKRIAHYFKPSKGRRHWDAASTMLKRGINTPVPVAFYERHRRSGIYESYYVCQFIPEAFSARQVCAAFRQGEAEFRGLDKHQWFELLTGFICRMHDAWILHRDLSVGNLLLTQDVDGLVTPYLIDVGRVYLSPKPLAGRQRILDLMRICYKLDWPDRNLFIQAYCKHWNTSFLPYWRLALSYYDFKQGGKKAVKNMLNK